MEQQNKEQQKKLLIEVMEADQKNGLYDIPAVEKKMTAVEWLVDQEISVDLGSGIEMKIPIPQNIIDKAKQMEKEQIIKAYHDDNFPCSHYGAEQYYNEIYGNK